MNDYKVRNFRWDDLEAVVKVWNAAANAVGNRRTHTADEMRLFFNQPYARVDSEVFVVEDGGRIIGYAADEFDDTDGSGFGECAVHPDYQNQGVGRMLLRFTDARIDERIKTEAKPDMPLYTLRVAIPSEIYTLQLFEEEGYREMRAFWDMILDLSEPIELEPMPEGITLRPFDAERDMQTVYEAHEEAFQDHWKHTHVPYDEWESMFPKYPSADTSLWLVAWEGDQIAGVAINRTYSSDKPEDGWLSVLAVRRPWRKRGLGSALLKQSFEQFRTRGYKRVGLSVDGSSLTNAAALYERAGMKVNQKRLVFRKMLRGTEADIQD